MDPRRTVLPLSPVQEGVLFESAMEQRLQVYVTQVNVAILGRLDPAILRRAWSCVASRHAALRSSLRWDVSGLPRQVVSTMPPPVDMPDVLPAGAGRFPDLDIDVGATHTDVPLVRFQVVKAEDDRATVTLTYHHLALDGWSVGQVLRELVADYHALAEGRTPEMTSDLDSYSEHFRSEADNRTARRSADASYWRRLLEGCEPPFRMACHPSAVRSHDSGRYAHRAGMLSAAGSSLLMANIRWMRLSFGAFVHACWAIVLRQHAERRKITFGSVFSGRSNDVQGTIDLVGLRARVLPIAIEVDPEETLRAFAGRIHQQLLETQEHEDVSLAEVLDWASISRADRPAFDTVLALALVSGNGADWSGTPGPDTITLGEVGTEERPPHALTMFVSAGEPISVYGIGRLDRLNGDTLERLTDALVYMLGTCSTHPDQTVSDLIAPTAATPRDARTVQDLSRLISDVWARTLGRPLIAEDDDFFTLGGDSIAALRLTGALRAELGILAPLGLVFDHSRFSDFVLACAGHPAG